MVVLDWENAFDKVMHDEMWVALEEIGIPEHVIQVLKALHANPKFRVREEAPSRTGTDNGLESDRVARYLTTCSSQRTVMFQRDRPDI